jgi:hypothetical protein
MGTKFPLTLLLVFGLLSAPALAWEVDVHYILTFWLAQQAGFSREDALAIAQADQEVDDSQYTSAIGSMIWILTKGDKGAAESVKRLHFPSDALFPSPPADRAVTPNSVDARREAENCLKLDTARDALKRLGIALHPLQDSWSHQGIPDVPIRPLRELRPILSSAHPEKRGGWNRHDADLTHLHPQDTLETGRETYELLLRYLQANPKRQNAPSKPWSAIEGNVKEFARAATREEKDLWATNNIPNEKTIADRLKEVSLPGDSTPPGKVRYLLPLIAKSAVAEPELEARARDFVRYWLVNGSPGAASEFVDARAIGDSFAKVPELAGDNPVASGMRWVRKTFASYLAGNHAAINAAGHAVPGSPGYKDIPESLSDGPFQMRKIPDATLPTKKDFVEVVEPGGASSWILAVWRTDLPHDALVLRWQKQRTWMIVQLIPIVE